MVLCRPLCRNWTGLRLESRRRRQRFLAAKGSNGGAGAEAGVGREESTGGRNLLQGNVLHHGRLLLGGGPEAAYR